MIDSRAEAPLDPEVPYEGDPGEQAGVDSGIWASHLASEVQMARDMGMESHTTIFDIDQNEHHLELSEGIDRIETEGRHTRIWLRNAAAGAGIITATGAAVVAAIALIRHRRRG